MENNYGKNNTGSCGRWTQGIGGYVIASLGLDTSTAVRMFLTAAMEAGGIPFPVLRRFDCDTSVLDAIERRKNGADFLTSEQSLANMRAAIKAGIEHES